MMNNFLKIGKQYYCMQLKNKETFHLFVILFLFIIRCSSKFMFYSGIVITPIFRYKRLCCEQLLQPMLAYS